ncbi:MAG: prephenate dehydrogenase [Candidatus Omnitrophota bacterium]
MIVFRKVSIIGVGLIGGSIGLAIKRGRLCPMVVGVGRKRSSIDRALEMSAIDMGTLNLAEGVKDADLIIVSAPAGKVKEKIGQAFQYARKGAIVIDVNSAKQDIMRFAGDLVPNDIYFVATHPMAGSERSGVSFADAGLFRESVCIITPDRFTDRKALERVKGFWTMLGAKVFLMPPKTHDEIVAKISHLPHVLAYVLCDMVSKNELALAGSGFRDATRIAGSSPEMWEEIFMQNKRYVLKAIGLFEKGLRCLKNDMVSGNRPALSGALKRAMKKRGFID